MFKSVLKNYFSQEKSILVTVLFVINSGISIASPYLNGIFIDFLVSNKEEDRILQLAFIIMIIGIMGIIISYALNVSLLIISNKTVFRTLKDSLCAIYDSELESIESIDPAYLTQRILSDINNFVTFVINNYISLIINIAIIAISILILINIKPDIILFLMILVPIYILIMIKLRKPLYETQLNKKETDSVFHNTVFNQIYFIFNIKINSQYEEGHNELSRSFNKYLDNTIRANRIGYILNSIDGIITVFFQSLMFVIGGLSIMNGSMTLGEFTMITSYFILLTRSIKYYVEVFKQYQDAKASYNRTTEIVSIQHEHNGTSIVSTIETIKMKSIYFRFKNAPSSMPMFEELSIDFNNPGLYVITGSNGTGKSTFIKLILGLYQNYKGSIYINDQNIRDIDMNRMRKENISVVAQKINFPSYTVQEHLQNSLKLTKQEYDQLLNEDDFIYTNTIRQLSEKNCRSLSAGEARKIALWTAFRKSFDILILDEPTTGLDYLSKESFCYYVNKNLNDKLIIIITHDEKVISLIRNPMNIISLEISTD